MTVGRVTKRLGELLIGKGLLSAWQLEAALSEQLQTKEFLGAILVRKGWISEDVLLQTLAKQFNLPYVRLADEQVDWQVAKRFTPALLTDHQCVPLRMGRESVTVAMCNPLDAWAVSELQREAGFRKVELVLAPAQDIKLAIQRCHQAALNSMDQLLKERDHGDHQPS